MTTHRSRSQRMAAWLMAALLALVVGEPLRVHECPMHLRSVVAPAAAHDASGHDASGHDASHAAAPSGAHAAAHAADAHGAPRGEHADDHGCDCLGTCCTVAPVAAPHVVAVRTSVTRVAAPAITARAPLAALPAPEHLLPFAIGPPRQA